ncbi:hypothetical protein [Kitasatospora cystarginea]
MLTVESVLAGQLLRHANEVRRLALAATQGRYSWLEQYLRGRTEATGLLREVVTNHGWPTYWLVGATASDAALYLLLEATALHFQRQCRELIAAAVAGGLTPPGHLTCIDHVISVASGEPPRYAGHPRSFRSPAPVSPSSAGGRQAPPKTTRMEGVAS